MILDFTHATCKQVDYKLLVYFFVSKQHEIASLIDESMFDDRLINIIKYKYYNPTPGEANTITYLRC